MAADPEPVPSDDGRIRAALWFAGHGFGVFSCWSAREDGTCRCPAGPSCGSPGKHPITQNGFQDATRDEARIRAMLAAGSHPNYGLVPPEGVFIWDVDGDGWREKLAALEQRHSPLPPTLRTETRNGQHVFLRWPEGHPRPLRQMFGWVTRWGSGPHSGYVIGPRSIHPSGFEYAPAGEAFEVATLPDAWARAVLDAEHSSDTIRVSGRPDPSTVGVGGRHDWLRDTARFYAGVVRDPDALFAAVWAENEKLPQPKTREEVKRAIGDALTKFPPDPVEQDPETGEERRAFGSLGMLSRGTQEDFPTDPDPVAFSGLLGEVVDFLSASTDASLVGLMGSLLPVCGALVPGLGYFQRDHPSTPWVALVGESYRGRKGTAINKVVDAMSDVVGLHIFNQTRLGGINSGEGLVAAMERRQLDAGPRGRTSALIIEEEYANLLAAAARENSTLDPKLRIAFDMGQLANVTKLASQRVDAPYWMAALIAITPTELREKVPPTAIKSGAMNRWLFLPVVKRSVIAANERPVLPVALHQLLKEARRVALEEHPTVEVPARVLAEISGYGEFLAGESVGLAADLTRRFPVIAFRIAMIHAAVERSEVITFDHYQRGVALTEYARRGIGWVFGYTVGNDITTLLLRHLQDKGELRTNEITQGIIRDPLKRQRAIDELEELGFARVESRTTGGRRANVLVLVEGRSGHRDFRAGEGAFVQQTGGGLRNSATPLADLHESPFSRSKGLHESLHGTARSVHETHESSGICPTCGAGPFLSVEFFDRHQRQEHGG